MLVLFDLDGFKAYNDRFGHPAGDALLARLARRIGRRRRRRRPAYRMGGDEFCVVASRRPRARRGRSRAARAALPSRARGSSIGASRCRRDLPTEAADARRALQLADQRLYANKQREPPLGRAPGPRRARCARSRERRPSSRDHLADVAELAAAVAAAARPGRRGDRRRAIAAELHDIGKIAIPDAILEKPGPLDEEEWEFIRGTR